MLRTKGCFNWQTQKLCEMKKKKSFKSVKSQTFFLKVFPQILNLDNLVLSLNSLFLWFINFLEIIFFILIHFAQIVQIIAEYIAEIEIKENLIRLDVCKNTNNSNHVFISFKFCRKFQVKDINDLGKFESSHSIHFFWIICVFFLEVYRTYFLRHCIIYK